MFRPLLLVRLRALDWGVGSTFRLAALEFTLSASNGVADLYFGPVRLTLGIRYG